MKKVVLIPAAGVGTRFAAEKPKQYIEVAGKTVLQHTLDIFLQTPKIDMVVAVIAPDDELPFELQHPRLRVLKCGGSSRAETVRNGVQAIQQAAWADVDDLILVHDAARCCLPQSALQRLLQAESYEDGAILAIPVADTLKRADGMEIEQTVSRTSLWQAQTPQMFRLGLLQEALSSNDLADVTDEASAVERLGKKPVLIRGDLRNLKLTLPEDLYLVRLLLTYPES